MKKFQVTMVSPQQIAQKGLKGCKTTRQVTAFAQKFNVPWTWYKPTPNYRMMLVDWPGFRTAWKENGNFATKTVAMTNTTKNNTWTQKSNTRRTVKARTGNMQKTTYATTRTTTPKAGFKNSYYKPATKTAYHATTKTTYRTGTTARRTRRAA